MRLSVIVVNWKFARRLAGLPLVAARADPVRYKPASHCGLRYHLTLAHPHLTRDAPSAHRTLTLFGKVYADLHQAYFVEAMMQRLYEEQGGLRAGTRYG